MEKRDGGKIVISVLITIIVMLGIIIGLIGMNVLEVHFPFEEEKSDKKESESDRDDLNKEQGALFSIRYVDEEYRTANSLSKRNLPEITSEKYPEASNKIMLDLTATSNVQWKTIKTMANEVESEEYQASSSLGVNLLLDTSVIEENRISFRLVMTGGFGGVSWENVDGYNYDTHTGEKLTLKDLGDGIFDIVLEECKKYIANSITSGLNENWQEDMKKYLEMEDSWYFTKDGLHVSFERYRLGIGALGVIQLEIPRDKIDHSLKEKYKF